MSHFSVLIALPGDTDPRTIEDEIGRRMEPWDENKDTPRYKRYQTGSPSEFWYVGSLRDAAEHHKNGTGIKPTDPDFLGISNARTNKTADEQREEYARRAKLAERLGDSPTWETIVEIYNEEFHPRNQVAVPGEEDDDPDEERLHYDAETGQAYTWSTYNPNVSGLVLCPGGQGSEEDKPTWDEVLRTLRYYQVGSGVRPGSQGERWAVRLLQDLHGGEKRSEDARDAETLAPQAGSRADAGAVRGDAGEAGRSVRDLPGEAGSAGASAEEESSTLAGSGSRSSYGAGTVAALRALQHGAGAHEGSTVIAHCGSGVPHEPHVRANGLLAGAKWDYWRVGGRWGGGYFAAKPGHPGLIQAHPDWDSPKERKPGYRADGGRVGSLDLALMREEAAAKAEAEYDTWEGIVAATPPARTRAEIFETAAIEQPPPGTDIRALWSSQPRVRACVDAGLAEKWLWNDPIEQFLPPREEYVTRARNAAVPGYALVTKDCEWWAVGEMGWFGMGSDDDTSRALAHAKMNEYIDGLAEDDFLIVIDAHI